MANGKSKNKRRMQNEMAELEIEKRSALLRMVAPIVIIIVVILGRMVLVSQGVEWASHVVFTGACYILALVFAGVCGFGARDWSRANQRMNQLKIEASRKSKKKR